jgi:hypothetical protein
VLALQARGGLRLADEALLGHVVGGAVDEEHLHGHALVEHDVVGRVDDGHAALARDLLDPVLSGHHVASHEGPRLPVGLRALVRHATTGGV